jgi:hypothetical protein
MTDDTHSSWIPPEEEPDLSEGLAATEVAVTFEAMYRGLRTIQGGVTVSLQLVPNDPAVAILLEGGQNSVWFCSLVRLGENSHTPDPTPSQIEGAKAVRRAAVLCKDPEFIRFCEEHGYVVALLEQAAATEATVNFMRNWLGIASRAQLRNDSAARARLSELVDRFYSWRDGQRPGAPL